MSHGAPGWVYRQEQAARDMSHMNEINSLYSKIKALEKENTELKNKIEELEKKIDELKKEP